MDGLCGKVAIVTGAAGGIGGAIVWKLAQRGVRVGAIDNSARELRASVDTLHAGGLQVSAFPADITTPSDVADAVHRVEDSLGPVDLLVNAAGVLRPGAAISGDLDDWETTFAVNVTGVFLVSSEVVRRMLRRSRGAIVTVCSNAATTPRAHMAAYASSKAASAMYTRCLGLEVARQGIRCNVVSPGSTQTAMLRQLWEDEDRRQATVDGDPAAFRLGIPLGKLARPSDVADAVAFLLSNQSGHITLQDLTIDGGATLGV